MVEAPLVSVDLETYAIALIVEESNEAGQMVGKWLRFGPDHARLDGLTARTGLSMEVGDVLAAIDFGLAAGVLLPDLIAEQKARKWAKLTDPEAVDDEGRRLAPELPTTPEKDATGDQVEIVARAISRTVNPWDKNGDQWAGYADEARAAIATGRVAHG